MKKVYIFEEEEFKNKMYEFIRNFQKYSKKGYGCKLVSNENGKVMDDFNSLGGSFLIPWNETFK